MAHREYHIEITLFSNDKIDALNTIVFISENYTSYEPLISIIWKHKQILLGQSLTQCRHAYVGIILGNKLSRIKQDFKNVEMEDAADITMLKLSDQF